MQRITSSIFAAIFFLLATSVFCAEIDSASAEAQIERGQKNIAIDLVGNVASIPEKVILLNPRIDNHSVSPETESYIREFISDNPQAMKDVKVRINQWSPMAEMGRLVSNKKISWWWRVFPGVPVTLWSSVTGRILGGDNYNPYTDTISVYSDEPAVLLHEAGHAKDMSLKQKGMEADLYALGRILPGVVLFQEFTASDEAIEHLKKKGDRKEEMKGYRTLYPAYGTYAGGYSGFQYGTIAGAVLGHGAGLWKQHERRIYYSCIDNIKLGEVVRDFEKDPLAKKLLKDKADSDKALEKALSALQSPIKNYNKEAVK